MTAALDLQITRHDLRPVPVPAAGCGEISEIEVYATVRIGATVADVVRFIYYDEKDGLPLETTFEVQVSGLPDAAGVADFLAETPAVLYDLAAVCNTAASILREAQGNWSCVTCEDAAEVTMCTGRWKYSAPCPECRPLQFAAKGIDDDHFVIGPRVREA